MGKLLSKIFGNKEMRILMLGLDAAGKTSILYKYTYNLFQHVLVLKRSVSFIIMLFSLIAKSFSI